MEQAEYYQSREDFLAKLSENYDQIHPINAGGGGIIYAGIHKRLNRKVVLKKIKADKLSVIGRNREMQILMNLKHTYLPAILDFWSYGDEVYTVMEFIEGKSFQELLDEGRTFSEKEVQRYTRQLLEVLEYLHAAKIIHSDIKPANLMLTPEDQICLIDFNVSLSSDGEEEGIGYSPGYSPVEQYLQIELRKLHKQNDLQNSNPAAKAGNRTDKAADIVQRKTGARQANFITQADTDVTQVDSDAAHMDAGITQVDTDVTQVDSGAIQADIATFQRENINPTQSKISAANSPTSAQPIPDNPIFWQMLQKYKKYTRVDERSDIYSAFATMYAIFTGHRPALCYEELVPVEKYVPSVSDSFAQILHKGLKQDPGQRYQSAAAALQAMKQLAKSSKRYKRLLYRQDLFWLVWVFVFAGSAAAAFGGWRMRNTENFYAGLQEASGYYENAAYEDALAFLQKEILPRKTYQKEEDFSQVYYLEGCCYLEEGSPQEAADSFRKAILLESSVPDYYCDYGIALARCGELDKAEECLLQAQAKGMEDRNGLLLQGEIAFLKGDAEKACSLFKECITLAKAENTPDSSLLLRAYLELDEAMNTDKEEQTLKNRIALLEEGLSDLNGGNAYRIRERLIQAYSDCSNVTGDSTYAHKAIDLLEEALQSGYASLAQWLNKAVLQQSIGEYEEAAETLTKAAEAYPDNYLVAKRLAFLELDVQSHTKKENRDYSLFQKYYAECKDLYDKAGEAKEQDQEMDYLIQLYNELASFGLVE